MADFFGWVRAIPLVIGMTLGRAAPFVFVALVVSFIAGAVIF